MDWGNDLWDQYDVIDKHTQSGLDLAERYIKFLKERSDIEQNYAKQLRSLVKKYAKKSSKEDPDSSFSSRVSFQAVLGELGDYAGQREIISEELLTSVCLELTHTLTELRSERKTYLADAKRAQQTLEASLKQLENTKKRFAKEWAEAEKAAQQVEKIENDINSTKADVDKARQQSQMRTHVAEESRNDYAAYLQKYNKEQRLFYHTDIPLLFNKLQAVEERGVARLGEGFGRLAETERRVTPILERCLEGMLAAAHNTSPAQDSMLLVEQHKSGFERPGDVEFEDYSQPIRAASSDSSLNLPRVTRTKLWPFSKKHKPPPSEDFSHLPPEQRKKRLQAKVDDITKDLQKELDQSEALEKMKGVYEQNAQLGDPASLEPQISSTNHNLGRLRGELTKYESWLAEALGGDDSTINTDQDSSTQNIYSEFDDDFEDMEPPIGQCTALYSFTGSSEGTVSVSEGEQLSVLEEDQGDGWMRVQTAAGDEGYIPASYAKII